MNKDTLQIGLAVVPGKPLRAHKPKLRITLYCKGNAMLGFRHGGEPSGDINPGDVAWAITHEGNETCYEVAIPWRTLGKNLTTPGPNAFLGFSAMGTDIDRSPTGRLTTRTLLDALGGMSWNNLDDLWGFGAEVGR